MGSFIRLPAKDLGSRIDAGYYRPDYVANAKRLLDSSLEHAELNSLVSGGRRTLYFGTSTLEEEQAPTDWVPFLTSDDLGDNGFFIETRARRRVAPSFLGDYPAGRLRSGELLVKVKGPNQTTAYIETAPQYPVLVSGTIWGALVRKEVVDPHYLVTALSCPYAVTARTRLRTNLNVEFLGAEDLLSLALPKPAPLAQRYIGDKVRQAERLRERARRLRADVNRRLDAVVPAFDSTIRSVSRIDTASLEPRLDCRPYRNHFRALEMAVRSIKHDRLTDVTDIASGDPVPSDEFTPVGVPLVRNRDIGPEGFWSTEIAVTEAYASRSPRYSASEGLIVVGMDGEFRAQFALDLELPLYINQRVAMLTARHIRPELLTEWLNRIEGQHQLNRWAVKTTVEHTNLEHIGMVLVPRLDDIEEGTLADRLQVARRSGWFARALIVAAQSLVEQLIDGRFTEADLVAAQKAIESGDRGADRAILRTLQLGDAPAAKPLIPDFDGLYTLLDEEDGAKDG
jgi:type I restriction enzyme S subunit